MKSKPITLLVLSFIFVLTIGIACLAGCTPDPKALYESKCSTCHDLELGDNTDYTTLEEWTTVVKDMRDKTTIITSDDATKIADYLATR